MLPVGGNANLSVFRYQHVGIPNAKLWRWGSKQTPGPNANGFAPQWNIGLYLGQKAHRRFAPLCPVFDGKINANICNFFVFHFYTELSQSTPIF